MHTVTYAWCHCLLIYSFAMQFPTLLPPVTDPTTVLVHSSFFAALLAESGSLMQSVSCYFCFSLMTVGKVTGTVL